MWGANIYLKSDPFTDEGSGICMCFSFWVLLVHHHLLEMRKTSQTPFPYPSPTRLQSSINFSTKGFQNHPFPLFPIVAALLQASDLFHRPLQHPSQSPGLHSLPTPSCLSTQSFLHGTLRVIQNVNMVISTSMTPCCLQEKLKLLFHAWFGHWVLLQMGLPQLPVPNLISVLHQFSCCFMFPGSTLPTRSATPSPSSTDSTNTYRTHACAGTQCPCIWAQAIS